MVNVNFKLKGKEYHLKDVKLMPGWDTYIEETEYQNHVATYIDQSEVSKLFFPGNLISSTKS